MAILYQTLIWLRWPWNTGLRCAPPMVILRGFAGCAGLIPSRPKHEEKAERPKHEEKAELEPGSIRGRKISSAPSAVEPTAARSNRRQQGTARARPQTMLVVLTQKPPFSTGNLRLLTSLQR